MLTSTVAAATAPRGNIQQLVSTKFCFAFNGPNGCKFVGCKYLHQCMKCSRSGHGAPVCRAGTQSRFQQGDPKGLFKKRVHTQSGQFLLTVAAPSRQKQHIASGNS